jgi:hypothetical protein
MAGKDMSHPIKAPRINAIDIENKKIAAPNNA